MTGKFSKFLSFSASAGWIQDKVRLCGTESKSQPDKK